MMIDLTFGMENNDCVLVSDDENMIGACIRRLDTVLDTTLYAEYGSNLKGLLGLRKTDVNLQFLNQTILQCLLQDERITGCSVDCQYESDGILANIRIRYEDNDLEFNYSVGGDVDG